MKKKQELLKALTAAGMQPFEFKSGNGSIVVTAHGARVLGAFTSDGAENAFFVNDELADPVKAAAFLAKEHVLGGDRLWIAPERGIFFTGNTEKDGVTTPAPVDPGQYRIAKLAGDTIKFVNEFVTPFHQVKESAVRGNVERTIRIIENPFAYAPDVVPSGRVQFVGYEINSRFELLAAPKDDLALGLWFLIQLVVPQGGYVYVPTLGRTKITDYYEPTGADYLRVEENHVRFKLDSTNRHKIGVRKTEVTGKIAYLSNEHQGKATLVVRNFLNNPSANYADVPLHTPAGTQDSVQSYNHFTGPSGFGEIEFHSPGVTRGMAEPVVTDSNQVWIFTGARADLVAIAGRLLGLPAQVFAV